jgi:hypothetical protein
MKIYLPNINYQCISVYDANTIRAYETQPSINIDINYTDYFINSHYLIKTGIQHFSDVDTIPICIVSEQLTTDWYYRNDITDILLIITIMTLFCIYIPLKLILRLFKRFN